MTRNLLHEVDNEKLDENSQLESTKGALGVRAGTIASWELLIILKTSLIPRFHSIPRNQPLP